MNIHHLRTVLILLLGPFLRTLTQYVSPPRSANAKKTEIVRPRDTNTTNLVMTERRKLSVFFSALLSQPAELLREDETMISKRSGNSLTLPRASSNAVRMIRSIVYAPGKKKLKAPIRKKMIEMYEQALWQNVGVMSEHMLLWWLDESLGKKNPLFAQKFNAWLKQYQSNGKILFLYLSTMPVLFEENTPRCSRSSPPTYNTQPCRLPLLLHHVHIMGRTLPAGFHIGWIPTRQARDTRHWPRKYASLPSPRATETILVVIIPYHATLSQGHILV